MYKISITGKANSGKNTLSKLLSEEIILQSDCHFDEVIKTKYIAFADPIKKMIRIMYPTLPRKYLYGPSKYRSEIIPGSYKDGAPLTIRQLLMDLGTGIGRTYKENIWLDAFDCELKKSKDYNTVIVTDVRFRNEFDHLKSLGFYQIRLLRNSINQINHTSETNQESIKNSEFDYIVNNNGSLEDLKKEVVNIVKSLFNL